MTNKELRYEIKNGLPDYGTGEIILTDDLLFEDGGFIEPGGEPMVRHWADIGGGYWVSEFGEVYSSKTDSILTPKKLDKQGHEGYCLYINGKRKYLYAHRLMAEAFLPKDNEDYNVVRHLNDIPNDNDLDNLAWGTQRENWEDSARNGSAHLVTPEEREIWLERQRRPTRATNINTGEVREYRCLNDAVKDIGVQQSNAHKVVFGKRTHTCGWKFEYI